MKEARQTDRKCWVVEELTLIFLSLVGYVQCTYVDCLNNNNKLTIIIICFDVPTSNVLSSPQTDNTFWAKQFFL
jgi:hypothetical protein